MGCHLRRALPEAYLTQVEARDREGLVPEVTGEGVTGGTQCIQRSRHTETQTDPRILMLTSVTPIRLINTIKEKGLSDLHRLPGW